MKKAAIIFTSVACFLLIAGIVIDVLMYGVFRQVFNFYFGTAQGNAEEADRDEIQDEARALAREIAANGFVMLENNGSLPYSGEKKVDLLGVRSADPVYNGGGSASTGDQSEKVSFRKAFEDAGYSVDSEVLKYYEDYRSSGNMGVGFTDFNVKDPDPESYWDKTTDATLGVVVFGRSGGESNDLPLTMLSSNAADADKHTLEFSANELALLEKAKSEYETLVVVINSPNPMELGPVKDSVTDEKGTTGNVDACFWVGMPGYHGLPALVQMIEGTVNPSGRLVDTWLYDELDSPTGSGFTTTKYAEGAAGTTNAKANKYTNIGRAYSEYAEGIYVGYRYYETATELGYIDYDEEVTYPFGYGMSYADFTWEVDTSATSVPDAVKGDSQFTVTVNVTNNGPVKGREVVQLYSVFDADTLKGGQLDRSAASLIAYAKTDEIEPGASDTVELTFMAEDLASYDDKGIYSETGSYVLESGKYTFALRSDSHTDKITGADLGFELSAPIVYNSTSLVDNADTSIAKRPTDTQTAVNIFGAYDESVISGTAYGIGVNYLGIDSSEEDWVNGTGRTGVRECPETLVTFADDEGAPSITNKDYVDHSGDKVVTGKDSGLSVADFADVPYGDPSWKTLVEQMSVSELEDLVLYGGYMTQEIKSVGKNATVDTDGPCGVTFIFNRTKFPCICYPNTNILAATFDKDLAARYGSMIAKEGAAFGMTGWYGPGANIHRNPFGGRNFEYMSEDPVLTGVMVANVCAQAVEGGISPMIKHFALNDQETDKEGMFTWCTEQAAREIYLKAFEYAFKAKDKFGLAANAMGTMTSFNNIGDRWCGASTALCTTFLRGECGFEGAVMTDYYSSGSTYMVADCAIRSGNDYILGTTGIVLKNGGALNNDDIYYLQRSAERMLYLYSRTWNVDNEYSGGMKTWEIVALIVNIVWWLGTAVLAFFAVRGWVKVVRAKKNDSTTQNV